MCLCCTRIKFLNNWTKRSSKEGPQQIHYGFVITGCCLQWLMCNIWSLICLLQAVRVFLKDNVSLLITLPDMFVVYTVVTIYNVIHISMHFLHIKMFFLNLISAMFTMLEILVTTHDSCETCDQCERNLSRNQPDLKIFPRR